LNVFKASVRRGRIASVTEFDQIRLDFAVDALGFLNQSLEH